MCFTSEGFAKGLRLTSDEGFFLFDEFWHSDGKDKNNFDFQNQFEWVHLTENEQVVGIAVDTITDDHRIYLKWLLGSSPEKPD